LASIFSNFTVKYKNEILTIILSMAFIIVYGFLAVLMANKNLVISKNNFTGYFAGKGPPLQVYIQPPV